MISIENLEKLAAGLTEPAIIIDSDLRVSFANESLCLILSATHQYVSSNSIFSLIDPLFKDNIIESRLRSCLSANTDDIILLNFDNKNELLFHVYPAQYINGKPNALVLISKTSLKSFIKEKDINEIQEDYLRAFNSIEDMLIIISKDKKIEHANQRALDYIGKDLEDIIGKNCCQMMHGKKEPLEFCPLSQVEKTRSTEKIEYFDDIRQKYLSVKCSPVYDENNEIAKYIEVIRDSSELKKIEHTIIEKNNEIVRKNEEYQKINYDFSKQNEELMTILEELNEANAHAIMLEQKYQRVFNSIADGLLIFNFNGTILDANDTACRMYGYNLDEFIGINGSDIVRSDHQYLFKQFLHDVTEKGKFTCKSIDIRKDGTEFYTEIKGRLFPFKGQNQLLAIVSDITEKVIYERELEKINKIINRSPSVAFIWEALPNWPVDFVSDNVERLFGYSTEDYLSGKVHYEDVIHPDDLPRVTLEVQESSKNPDLDTFVHKPYRIITKNGEIKWIDDRTYIHRENDKIIHYEGILTDITDLIDSQIAQNESEERFRSLFDNSLSGIFYIDTDGNILEANQTIVKMLGSPSVEETKKINVFNFKPIIDIGYADDMKKSIQEEITVFGEKKYESKWGIELIIKYYFVPIKREGKVIGIMANLDDITELRKAEESLKYSESKYRLLFESSRDGLVQTDLDGNFINCNHAFLDMLGYSLDELQEMKFYDITPEEYHEWEKEEIVEKRLIKKGYSDRFEKEYIRKDGTRFPVQIQAYLMKYDNDNKPILWGVARDISQEMKYQNELRENARFLKSILDNIISTITKVDLNGIIDYASPSWYDTVGYKPEDVTGKNVFEFIHPDDHKSLKEAMQKAFYDELSGVEYRFKHKSGKYLWCEARGNSISDAQGNLKGALFGAMITDDRKKAELKLKESERKTKAILNSTMQSFVLLDENRLVLAFNQAIKTITMQLFNRSIQEGDSMDLFILPRDLDEYKKDFAKSWSGKSISKEKTYDIGDMEFSSLTHYNPVYDGDEVVAVSMNAIDITERKKFEKALIKRDEHFTSLLSNPQGYFIYRLETTGNPMAPKVTHVSPSIKEILGIDESDIYIFQKWFMRIHPEDLPELLRRNEEGANPPFVFDGTFRYNHPDGRMRWLNVRAKGIPLEKDKEKIHFSNGIVIDITEQKEIEQQLIIERRRAEESDRLKSAFLANMSHEIRTPMNSIVGFSKLIAEPDSSKEEINEYIRIINANSEQLLSIINDILDISKIESGIIAIQREDVDINRLYRDLLSSFKPKVYEKKIKLVNEIVNPIAQPIISDYIKLRQILSNLIGNAIKFTHQGSVSFGHIIENNKIIFFVKDTGIGIQEDYQDMIFERFRQVEDSLSKNKGGTGLGLSISKKLVNVMGGKIWLESETGKGSEFYFSIPLEFASVENIIEEEIIKQYDWSNKNILLVEDDPNNTLLVEKILRRTKVKVIKLTNGKEAVDYLKVNSRSIDLVLMDIKMPVMDGFDALEKIRAFDTEIPIIAQTAYALAEDRVKASSSGFNDFLAKPFQENMLDKIEEHFK